MKTKYVVAIASVSVAVLLIVGALLFTYLFPSDPLSDISPEEVSEITVGCGETGESVTLSLSEDIKKVFDGINPKALERGKSAEGVDGFSYSLSLKNEKGEIIESFAVNSESVIVWDGYFYESSAPTCFAFLEELFDDEEIIDPVILNPYEDEGPFKLGFNVKDEDEEGCGRFGPDAVFAIETERSLSMDAESLEIRIYYYSDKYYYTIDSSDVKEFTTFKTYYKLADNGEETLINEFSSEVLYLADATRVWNDEISEYEFSYSEVISIPLTDIPEGGKIKIRTVNESYGYGKEEILTAYDNEFEFELRTRDGKIYLGTEEEFNKADASS